jgi:hypothetical protein
MTRTKILRGECQQCGGQLTFPAEQIGMVVRCPHCATETELMLAIPAVEPMIPRKVLVWTGITVAVLIVGFGILLAGLSHFEKEAARKKQKAAPAAQSDTNGPAVGALPGKSQ